jgi:hypothetical protein
VTALLLFAAFLVAWESERPLPMRRLMVVGLLSATAIFVEFPTVPAAAIIGLYAAGFRLTRRTTLFVAAAAVPVIALALYLTFAFGSPVRVGYEVLSDAGSRAEMLERGVFGMTYPHVGVIIELLLGRYRGLLPYSPLFFLSIPGFVSALHVSEEPTPEETSRRNAALLCGAMVVYYLLFVSSYAWWQGGSSFGSRHLIPMLPFFIAPAGLVVSRRPKLGLALLVPSVAVMMIVTAVQPKPSDQFQNPFWKGILPAFVNARLASNDVCPTLGKVGQRPHESFVEHGRYDAFNLGMVLGGRGHKSLVPLYALWLTALWAFARATGEGGDQTRNDERADGNESGQRGETGAGPEPQ